jgi:hypothetical protein
MDPVTDQIDHITALVIDHLPQGVEERIARLETLLGMVPRHYLHRDELEGMLQALKAHQLHQLQFRALLNGKAK